MCAEGMYSVQNDYGVLYAFKTSQLQIFTRSLLTSSMITDEFKISFCQKSSVVLAINRGYSFNFFPTHRTLWDDRKFFPSRRVSHWWTTSTTSFVDTSHTGVQR